MNLFKNNDMEDLFGIKDVFMSKKAAQNTTPAEPEQKNISIENKTYSNEEAKQTLNDLNDKVNECKLCRLGLSRTNTVFGEGALNAKLMFVGEGPGAEEDKQGRPFVGKSGQLLTKMIIAMGFKREDVYIANIVKCRPPDNRNPFQDEADACIHFLKKQINIIKPQYIICLGSVAVSYLLKDSTPITRLRGNWREFEGIKVMPTYHPSYLLRSPNKKVEAWQDLKSVMKELGLEI